MGVGKNWVSELAESSTNVLDISLESSSTVTSSMRRGVRKSSIDTGWCCCCFDAIFGVHVQGSFKL